MLGSRAWERGKKAARMRYVAFACHAPLRDFWPPPVLVPPKHPTTSQHPLPYGPHPLGCFMHELLSWLLLFGIRCLIEHMALVCGINFMPLHFVGHLFFSTFFFWSFSSPKWPLQNWFVWSPKALKFPSSGICFSNSSCFWPADVDEDGVLAVGLL